MARLVATLKRTPSWGGLVFAIFTICAWINLLGDMMVGTVQLIVALIDYFKN
jgi:hypothetical protein